MRTTTLHLAGLRCMCVGYVRNSKPNRFHVKYFTNLHPSSINILHTPVDCKTVRCSQHSKREVVILCLS
ncbi:hypothetical protein PR048_005691 [Dryococelus australis]|uniref:Secreted protein n=1 Tax=Dryococelus australis TaxID=614101 RepID=A0ABQ9IB21_9NEOP|nr:hypothetical protein PR048_005691 [Dryococelus australis]